MVSLLTYRQYNETNKKIVLKIQNEEEELSVMTGFTVPECLKVTVLDHWKCFNNRQLFSPEQTDITTIHHCAGIHNHAGLCF